MTDIWDWYRERNISVREDFMEYSGFQKLINEIMQEDKDLLEYFRQRN